jgi:putative transposase
MRRESHVRFYEGGGVRFPAATRLIPLGERHLRTTVHEFVEHYHSEQNHQGLGNVIPFPSPPATTIDGRICRCERLGGLLNFYERKSA